ncbi:MAG: hypothetical protein HY042_05530, partial [Spirochaetia bacterium]|nr:hypothetical protein [Spirochaetia bacterium]
MKFTRLKSVRFKAALILCALLLFLYPVGSAFVKAQNAGTEQSVIKVADEHFAKAKG